MIRVRRGRRRGPRNPWDFSVDDYKNRRYGLILVRRFYDMRILSRPFECGRPPRFGRRKRRNTEDDVDEGK